MNDLQDRDNLRPDERDLVAELMRAAGRRAEPPAGAYERVFGAASARWHAKLRRRRRRNLLLAAAAFTLVLLSTVFVVNVLVPERALVAAHTARVIGVVRVKQPGGKWSVLSGNAEQLPVATHVQTQGGSRAGISMSTGASLRLDESTDVVLLSETAVRVLAGKVYVDTHDAKNRSLQVITPAASAIDVGTQFEVQYRDAAYRLRVRTGLVRLYRKTQSLESMAGEQVLIDGQGQIARRRVSAADGEWQWTQALAPTPDIEGQPLTLLLSWVSRETGRSIRYENAAVERKAQGIIMHGNIRLLEPLDALTVMLATTDLQHVLIADDAILIKARMPPR